MRKRDAWQARPSFLKSLVGASVRRVDDPRLLRGASEYLDDVSAPDALHVAFVRSPYAHALVRRVSTDEAERSGPAVVAVVTGAGLGASNGPFPHPTWFPAGPALTEAIRPVLKRETIQLLAVDRVRFMGDPVAAVVATDRYEAEDAARLVDVEYEPLPAVVDPELALEPATPLLNPAWGTNLALHFSVTKGDLPAAFRQARHLVRGRFVVPRQTGSPIEPRGTLAAPDRRSGGLTVWSSTQTPHWLRDALVVSLGLSEDRLRVVAPDVGGGFGIKSMVYPEELLVALLALRLQRRVKWVDTRREHFQSAIHARSQRHDVELALSEDGVILGLRDEILIDAGAANVEALIVPYNTAAHLQGTYRVPALEVDCSVVVTNKVPLSAYRGAGRPEAVFAMERILDRASVVVGLDPIEMRRQNTLGPAEMPYDTGILYRDGEPMILDGGDYPLCLEQALERIDYAGVKAAQARQRMPDRLVGVGLASYVEGTGIGPFEGARVALEPSGSAVVTVALPSQGQGHETTLAQIAGDALGLAPTRIRVVQGDTLAFGEGGGTIASRTAVVVGSAVHEAAGALRLRVLRLAADALEARLDDLVLADGRVHVTGSPARSITLGELAASVAPGIGRPDAAGEGPLRTEAVFQPSTVTFANGVHAVQVEVDRETGRVAVTRYVVVHDCGRLINPAIVEGQIRGGVAQGIGGALTEELVYDDTGQLLTGSLMDYGLPRSTDVPAIDVVHLESPSTRNPLGIKGVGEAGCIAVAPAIALAVEDALGIPPGTITTYPLTPEAVLRAATDAVVTR